MAGVTNFFPRALGQSLFYQISENRSPVIVRELDEHDQGAIQQSYLSFQYFPESISDRKEAPYSRRAVFGGSLPIYQWSSGGARTIAFRAVFASDCDLKSPGVSLQKLRTTGHAFRNVDIRTAVLWLRRFTMPMYTANTTNPPRKLFLTIPGSAIGMQGGLEVQADGTQIPDSFDLDSVLCVMTQCDIVYEAFFPSGMPRLTTVDLAFEQIAQLGGAVRFPGNSGGLGSLVGKGQNSDSQSSNSYYPYNVWARYKR